jgi:hypothetical protein
LQLPATRPIKRTLLLAQAAGLMKYELADGQLSLTVVLVNLPSF